jgi:hypothetical protein
MKTIVTHYMPDQDAITSVWLVKKFAKGWEDAEVIFVAAGKTLNDEEVDSDSDVLHVDTGFGVCDHHRVDSKTCAAVLTWQWIKDKGLEARKVEEEVMQGLLSVVNDVDHFGEVRWADPSNDRYDFVLERIIDGWKLLYPGEDQRLIQWGMDSLDGILQILNSKYQAKKELEAGVAFETKWGKAIALETTNDEVTHLGQKLGYNIVVRKDPRKGYLRVKSMPDPSIDLTELMEKLKEKDLKATWFLHPDHHQLLNGSTKNPDMRPTTLTLEEVVEILKKI